MTLDPKQLIDGYMDETLSPEEHAALNQWLKDAPENSRQFAHAILLHDHLRSSQIALVAMDASHVRSAVAARSNEPPSLATTREPRRVRPLAVSVGIAIATTLLVAVLWKGLGDTPASAAVAEINRLIVANLSTPDRTYRIDVEEQAAISKRELPDDAPERSRPTKPSIDRAVLYVRSGGLFVLMRKTMDGHPFVTGSNGQLSWAVKPRGPVRFSADLTRFHRDVPGHEHSMPLININVGLEQLREAYEVQLLPIENPDDPAADSEPNRLIVAVRKPGHRGPRRVEVTYSVQSGLIRQMRFVEMPYGPERLTLRMTLVDEQPLGAKFFDHDSHHDSDRILEQE